MNFGGKAVPQFQYERILNDRSKYYIKYQDLKTKQKELDEKFIEFNQKIDQLMNQNEYLETVLREQFEKHDKLINTFDEALKFWKIDQDELEERKRTINELKVKIYHLEKKREIIDLTNEPESEPFSIDLNEPASDEE